MNFYRCQICGQVVMKHVDYQNNLTCCKQELELMNTNVEDVADDIHNIEVRHVGNFLNVTVKNHPMKHIHHIAFIALKTNLNYQTKPLCVDQSPEALFVVDMEEEIEYVYAYCNIHGLLSFTYKTA